MLFEGPPEEGLAVPLLGKLTEQINHLIGQDFREWLSRLVLDRVEPIPPQLVYAQVVLVTESESRVVARENPRTEE